MSGELDLALPAEEAPGRKLFASGPGASEDCYTVGGAGGGHLYCDGRSQAPQPGEEVRRSSSLPPSSSPRRLLRGSYNTPLSNQYGTQAARAGANVAPAPRRRLQIKLGPGEEERGRTASNDPNFAQAARPGGEVMAAPHPERRRRRLQTPPTRKNRPNHITSAAANTAQVAQPGLKRWHREPWR